jgi:hypothetical protein
MLEQLLVFLFYFNFVDPLNLTSSLVVVVSICYFETLPQLLAESSTCLRD